jgi:hypothetical protein
LMMVSVWILCLIYTVFINEATARSPVCRGQVLLAETREHFCWPYSVWLQTKPMVIMRRRCAKENVHINRSKTWVKMIVTTNPNFWLQSTVTWATRI